MILVADQNDAETVAREPHGLQMHLGDQRAGGIDHFQMALRGLLANRGSHAVRAEDGPRTRRHFVQFLDEDGAGLAQFVHHVLVVYDFLAHVDRRTVEVERDLHHVDRPYDTGAKASRLEQKNLLIRADVGSKRL